MARTIRLGEVSVVFSAETQRFEGKAREAADAMSHIRDEARRLNTTNAQAARSLGVQTREYRSLTDAAKLHTRALRDQRRAQERVRRSMAALGRRVFGLRGAVGALAGAGAFGALVKTTTEFAASLVHQATALGVSVEQLQLWRNSLAAFNVENKQADTIVSKLNRSLGDARAGIGRAASSFARIGIDVAGLRSAEDALLAIADVADRFDAATRKSVLTGILGSERDADRLLSVVAAGRDALAEQLDRSREIGFVTTANAQRLERLDTEIGRVADAFRTRLAEAIAGNAADMTALAESAAGMAARLPELAGRLRDNADALKALGIAFAGGALVRSVAGLAGAFATLRTALSAGGSLAALVSPMGAALTVATAGLGAVFLDVRRTRSEYDRLVEEAREMDQLMTAPPSSRADLTARIRELQEAVFDSLRGIDELERKAETIFPELGAPVGLSAGEIRLLDAYRARIDLATDAMDALGRKLAELPPDSPAADAARAVADASAAAAAAVETENDRLAAQIRIRRENVAALAAERNERALLAAELARAERAVEIERIRQNVEAAGGMAAPTAAVRAGAVVQDLLRLGERRAESQATLNDLSEVWVDILGRASDTLAGIVADFASANGQARSLRETVGAMASELLRLFVQAGIAGLFDRGLGALGFAPVFRPVQAHGGTPLRDWGAGTPAVLHGREAVLTESQIAALAGGSTVVNVSLPAGATPSQIAEMRNLAPAIEAAVARGIGRRGSPVRRAVLSVLGGR